MNLLNKTRVYLIGGMQNFQNGDSWRREIKQELQEMNITCFDPYIKPFINEIKEDHDARKLLLEWMENEEYSKVEERMKAVRSDDLRLCDISDFGIAYIHPKIASWGSAEEIFWMNRLKKPIFIIVEGGKKQIPLWLLGMLPHKYFYNSVDEVVAVLKNINCGEKPMDSSRFRLLKEDCR